MIRGNVRRSFKGDISPMYSKGTSRIAPRIATPIAIHHHFSTISKRYRNLRTTDLEPVNIVVRELKNLVRIKGIDIGCGAGRYDLLLCQYLGDRLRLTCVDDNDCMLEELDKYLIEHGLSNFESMHSEAEYLPFPNNALDCVCAFNAIHHFNLPEFLHESYRILKNGGYLFIYTRLHEQNGRNIWGRYFPKFHIKETRLYTLDTLMALVAASNLHVKSIEYFKYGRISTLAQLVKRAREHHYSTFSLYLPEELEEAITRFKQNIRSEFEDINQIRWFDENVLFVVRKEG
jgi:ubiquinone/menaquinone biosynthesis C-methylase UbiE